MSPEHVVLCGGAPARGLGRAGKPLKLDIYGRNPVIHFKLEEVRRALWKDIPDVLRDLLDLAVYVYAADQAVERADGGRVDGDEIGAGWRRKFQFRVPVRLPDLWKSTEVGDTLVSTLSFLSEDEYTFEFSKLENEHSLSKFIDYDATPFDRVVEEVVMFSGGLDSLAGAVTEAVVEGRQVLLVNHRSSEKMSRRHRQLLRGLAAHATDCAPLHVPVWVNKEKRLGYEFTQRTRSFLFAALGATFARMIGLDRLRFYENGVISLNLPISAQVVGARASRTTHPRVLAGFERLLGELLHRPFTVENRFLWDTKADVVRRIAAEGCADLIGLSQSCGHTWKLTKGHTHCGVCSQCIDRRFGVLAAEQGVNDPVNKYEVELLTDGRVAGPPRALLTGYMDLVARVERMGEAEFLTHFGEVARVLPFLGPSQRLSVTRVFELYQKHAKEVTGVVNQAMADAITGRRWRELPGGCLLRLVFDAPPGEVTEQTESVRPAGNSFVSRGKYWGIRFGDGNEWPYPKERGYDYLRLLLAAPTRNFSAAELDASVRSLNSPTSQVRNGTIDRTVDATSTRPVGDDLHDEEYRECLRARLPLIDEALEHARASGTREGFEGADELEQEKKRITAELSKSKDRWGRPRKLGDPRDRVRNRVCNAIRRALRQIANEDPPLAAHLVPPILNLGHTISYVPRSDVNWAMEVVPESGQKTGLHEK